MGAPQVAQGHTRELWLIRGSSPESQIGRFRYCRNGPRRKWRKISNQFGPKTWWRSCPPYFRNNGGDIVMPLHPYPWRRWCPRNQKTEKIVRLGGEFIRCQKVSPTKKYNFAEVLGRHKKLQKQIFDILLLSMLFFTMSAITAKSLFSVPPRDQRLEAPSRRSRNFSCAPCSHHW